MKKRISMIMVVVLIASTLAACGGGAGGEEYTDGTYNGVGAGYNGDDIHVEVVVEDGKISEVNVGDHEETDGIADPALEQIPADIVEKNSTDVDAISEATGTSEGIMEAVEDALSDAK